MPAHRKRPGTRQDNRPQRDLAVVTAGPVESVPVAPRGWLKATYRAWDTYWRSEVSRALEDVEQEVLERLFSMRDLQSRAWVRYRKRPYVDGSQGQPVANPAFGEAMALEKAITALEDRLGVSPKARANLGIAFGQAQLTASELNRMATVAEVGEVSDADLLDGYETAN